VLPPPIQGPRIGKLLFRNLLENTLQVQGRDPFHIFEHAVGRVCEGTTHAMHYR